MIAIATPMRLVWPGLLALHAFASFMEKAPDPFASYILWQIFYDNDYEPW